MVSDRFLIGTIAARPQRFVAKLKKRLGSLRPNAVDDLVRGCGKRLKSQVGGL
jgi:hypothetical protein